MHLIIDLYAYMQERCDRNHNNTAISHDCMHVAAMEKGWAISGVWFYGRLATQQPQIKICMAKSNSGVCEINAHP